MALPRDDKSNDDAHQGVRRGPPRATKAAQCTGVDEAAFASTMNDAKDDDVAPRDEDSDNGANDDADDDAEKGAKRGRPGRLMSTEQGTYVRQPPPTTATTPPMMTPPTRSKSQGRPTRPMRQRGTARGVYAWQSPATARWQCDRDGATAT
jgi:hypothetical protein